MRATSLYLAVAAVVAGLSSLTVTAGAQAPAPASRTRIITLGTAGGPLPQKDRAQSSNLLIVDGALYLIDAGDSVTRRLVEAGQDFRKVDKVFITHGHSDHTAGLATLLVSQWEFQRREPLEIFGPIGTRALVDGALRFLTPNSEIRWAEGKRIVMSTVFQGREVEPGPVYQDARVKVTAVENPHFTFPVGTPPYGKHRSYSYRFDTPGRVIVFTGDTGPSDAVVAFAKGADVLVTEVTSVEDTVEMFKRNGLWSTKTADEQEAFVRHLREEHVTPEDVGRMASKAGVKMVVMTHISPTVDPNRPDQYAEMTRKHFSGRVVIAKDLMEF